MVLSLGGLDLPQDRAPRPRDLPARWDPACPQSRFPSLPVFPFGSSLKSSGPGNSPPGPRLSPALHQTLLPIRVEVLTTTTPDAKRLGALRLECEVPHTINSWNAAGDKSLFGNVLLLWFGSKTRRFEKSRSHKCLMFSEGWTTLAGGDTETGPAGFTGLRGRRASTASFPQDEPKVRISAFLRLLMLPRH